MALPEDRDIRLRCFRNALRNWNYKGYVKFKPVAEEWLEKKLPDLNLRQISHELHRYVDKGGEIDEQVERRAEFVSYEFHYDLRVPIGNRRVLRNGPTVRGRR